MREGADERLLAHRQLVRIPGSRVGRHQFGARRSDLAFGSGLLRLERAHLGSGAGGFTFGLHGVDAGEHLPG